MSEVGLRLHDLRGLSGEVRGLIPSVCIQSIQDITLETLEAHAVRLQIPNWACWQVSFMCGRLLIEIFPSCRFITHLRGRRTGLGFLSINSMRGITWRYARLWRRPIGGSTETKKQAIVMHFARPDFGGTQSTSWHYLSKIRWGKCLEELLPADQNRQPSIQSTQLPCQMLVIFSKPQTPESENHPRRLPPSISPHSKHYFPPSPPFSFFSLSTTQPTLPPPFLFIGHSLFLSYYQNSWKSCSLLHSTNKITFVP